MDIDDEKFYAGGLIGYIDTNAKRGTNIKNCHVSNGYIKGRICGGILGRIKGYDSAKSKFHITDCSNSCKIEGSITGGICGTTFYTYCYFINCMNAGTISADKYASGIAAKFQGEMSNCCNRGNITGKEYASGVVANAYSDAYLEIDNCVNYGVLQSDNPENACAILSTSTNKAPVYLTNNFYVSDTPMTGKVKITKEENNHALTDAEMKSAAILTALNSTGNPEYCNWLSDSRGYPILDYYAEILADVDNIPFDDKDKAIDYSNVPDDGIVDLFSMTGVNVYSGPKNSIPLLEKGVYIVIYDSLRFKVVF